MHGKFMAGHPGLQGRDFPIGGSLRSPREAVQVSRISRVSRLYDTLAGKMESIGHFPSP